MYCSGNTFLRTVLSEKHCTRVKKKKKKKSFALNETLRLALFQQLKEVLAVTIYLFFHLGFLFFSFYICSFYSKIQLSVAVFQTIEEQR